MWGKRWLPATLSEENADPDLVMWDMHRSLHLERVPVARTVVEFEFNDQPDAKRLRWILVDPASAELCITDPGVQPDLVVSTDSQTLTLVWFGDMPIARAIEQRRIRLLGPRRLCAAFPSWLRLSPLAAVPRQPAVPGSSGS